MNCTSSSQESKACSHSRSHRYSTHHLSQSEHYSDVRRSSNTGGARSAEAGALSSSKRLENEYLRRSSRGPETSRRRRRTNDYTSLKMEDSHPSPCGSSKSSSTKQSRRRVSSGDSEARMVPALIPFPTDKQERESSRRAAGLPPRSRKSSTAKAKSQRTSSRKSPHTVCLSNGSGKRTSSCSDKALLFDLAKDADIASVETASIHALELLDERDTVRDGKGQSNTRRKAALDFFDSRGSFGTDNNLMDSMVW